MEPPPPQQIANLFVERFYRILEVRPEELSRFYKEESSSTIAVTAVNGTSETAETVSGLGPISARVMSKTAFAQTKTRFIDAQHSAGGGLLLQVLGTMEIKGVTYEFAESFYLARQESGYYVYNDILRLSVPATPAFGAQAGGLHESTQTISDVPVPVSVPVAVVRPAAPAREQPQAPPAATAAAAAPAAVPLRDAEVPQPVKQATPPRPVAPPAPVPANMTYAQRLKLSAQAPAVAAAAAAAEPQPVAPQAVEPAEHVAPTANGHSAPPPRRPTESNVIGVFVKGLPQDDLTVEMLEPEFAKFGALVNVSIHTPKFGFKTAQVRYVEAASMEAALKGEVVLAGKRLTISRLRPDVSGPRGPPAGGRGGPGGRYGSGMGRSRDGGGGGRGGPRPDRSDDRPDRPPRTEQGPPRERTGDRAEDGKGADKGANPRPDGEKRSNSRRGQRSGSAPRANTNEGGDSATPAQA